MPRTRVPLLVSLLAVAAATAGTIALVLPAATVGTPVPALPDATVGTPVPATASATTAPLVLRAVADASVSAHRPHHNFGTAQELTTGRHHTGFVYMRFRVPAPRQGEAYVAASLRLHADSTATRGFTVSRAHNGWSERRVTWSNQPPTSGPTSRIRSYHGTGWVSVDVSPEIPSGGGAVTFRVSSEQSLLFSASETGAATAPELTLTAAKPGTGSGPKKTPTSPPTAPSSPSPTDSPTGSTLVPADLLDLSQWSLDLPITAPSSSQALEIKQPALATFALRPYFWTDGRGVTFDAPVGGATTSGSSYPRSELREMANDGTTQAAWSTTSGTHTMVVTEASTHLPVKKPQVVTAQIHDSSSDVIEIVADGSGSRRTSPTTYSICLRYYGITQTPCLDSRYVSGTKFTVKLVAAGGHIAVFYDGVQKFDFTVASSGDYFKAGAYTLSNPSKGDAPTAYGEVRIYHLNVTHTY